ncbi:LysR family transcriptional regulator [Paraburkholderia fungorum]|uniref:LysR family transcriptional regulator n=1 Tax=Paraburkholderia fungorum TaxID=134537 RepID=UPI0038BABDBC
MQSDKTISCGILDDLSAFVAVARTLSFSRAAAELNVSNSMLSYTIKRLERRLGYPLLRRNSRSVAPTAEGQTLLLTLQPALEAIDGALGNLSRTRDRISGTLRITATREGYEAVIRPVLSDFSATYPGATVEVIIDYAFRDIVSDRFDAGIRLGEKLEQDMVALPVGPSLRMAVVASPAYLLQHRAPVTPEELQHHRCINYRMESTGSLYPWEFENDGRKLKVALSGPLTFNEPGLMLQAAVDGLGVAYILEHEAAPHVETGRLVRILDDWCPPFAGFFLYYPSRKQVSPVLAAFVKRLRAQ